MDILRTPDERFADLPDFPYEPHYAEIPDGDGGTLRVHYVDEPADTGVDPSGETILLLHGEPTWSYLYRHMIPVFTAAGHRVVAPDLVGFGRSDKPTRHEDYTYARHVDWMAALLFDHLDLQGVTLFGQDWGGLIGLRLVGRDPDRFARIVVGNTGLPDGTRTPNEAFLAWQKFSRESPTFPIGAIINGGCLTDLTPEVIAAYDAPFPDDASTAGARILPSLVPTGPEDPAVADQRAAWAILERFDRPFLCAFSDGDPITKGGERAFLGTVPGAEGQPHTTIEGGGHFLQEDRGPQLAAVINDFVAGSPR